MFYLYPLALRRGKLNLSSPSLASIEFFFLFVNMLKS